MDLQMTTESEFSRFEYTPLLDMPSTWFQRWYFELRLKEEIYRAQRYGQLLAVVLITFSPGLDRISLDASLRAFATSRLRLVDVPGRIEENEFGLLLPHTGIAGAGVVAGRVSSAFDRFPHQVGLAIYPDDGENFWQLWAAARSRLGTTDGASPPSQAA